MFPRLISIGSFFLPTYGTLVALGFLVGLFVTVRLAKRAGLKPDPMVNLAIYSALAGLLGAKIAMLLFDFPAYWAHPGDIFTRETLQAAGVYQGGISVSESSTDIRTVNVTFIVTPGTATLSEHSVHL